MKSLSQEEFQYFDVVSVFEENDKQNTVMDVRKKTFKNLHKSRNIYMKIFGKNYMEYEHTVFIQNILKLHMRNELEWVSF